MEAEGGEVVEELTFFSGGSDGVIHKWVDCTEVEEIGAACFCQTFN